MIGFPRKSLMFFLGIRLLPPRAGMMAIFDIEDLMLYIRFCYTFSNKHMQSAFPDSAWFTYG